MATQLTGQTFAEWMKERQQGGGSSAAPKLPTISVGKSNSGLPGQSFSEWYASQNKGNQATQSQTQSSESSVAGEPQIGQWHSSLWQKLRTALGNFHTAVKAGFSQEAERIFDPKQLAEHQRIYAGLPTGGVADDLPALDAYQPQTLTEKIGQFGGTNLADLPFYAASDLIAGPVAGAAGKTLPKLAQAVIRGGVAGGIFGAGTETLGGGSPSQIAEQAGESAGGWAAMGAAGEGLARLGSAILKGLRNVPEGATTRELNAVVDDAVNQPQMPEIVSSPEALGEAIMPPQVESPSEEIPAAPTVQETSPAQNFVQGSNLRDIELEPQVSEAVRQLHKWGIGTYSSAGYNYDVLRGGAPTGYTGISFDEGKIPAAALAAVKAKFPDVRVSDGKINFNYDFHGGANAVDTPENVIGPKTKWKEILDTIRPYISSASRQESATAAQALRSYIFTNAGFASPKDAIRWAYDEVSQTLQDEHPGYTPTYVPARKVANVLAKRLGVKQVEGTKLLRETISQLFEEGNGWDISTGDTRIPAQSIGNGIGSIMFKEGYEEHGYEPTELHSGIPIARIDARNVFDRLRAAIREARDKPSDALEGVMLITRHWFNNKRLVMYETAELQRAISDAVPDSQTRSLIFYANAFLPDRELLNLANWRGKLATKLTQISEETEKDSDKRFFLGLVNKARTISKPDLEKAISLGAALRAENLEIFQNAREHGMFPEKWETPGEAYVPHFYAKPGLRQEAATVRGRNPVPGTLHQRPRVLSTFAAAVDYGKELISDVEHLYPRYIMNIRLTIGDMNFLNYLRDEPNLLFETTGRAPNGYVHVDLPHALRRPMKIGSPLKEGEQLVIMGNDGTVRASNIQFPRMGVSQFYAPQDVASYLKKVFAPDYLTEHAPGAAKVWYGLKNLSTKLLFANPLIHAKNIYLAVLPEGLSPDPISALIRMAKMIRSGKSAMDNFDPLVRDAIKRGGLNLTGTNWEIPYKMLQDAESMSEEWTGINPKLKQAIDAPSKLLFEGIVGNAQVGLFKLVYDQAIKRGLDHLSALKVASTFANHVAGQVGTEEWNPLVRSLVKTFLLAPKWMPSRWMMMGKAAHLGMRGLTDEEARMLTRKFRVYLAKGFIYTILLSQIVNFIINKRSTLDNEDWHQWQIDITPITGLDNQGRRQYLDLFGWWSDYIRLPKYTISGEPGKYFFWKIQPLAALLMEALQGRNPQTGKRADWHKMIQDFLTAYMPAGIGRFEGQQTGVVGTLTGMAPRPGGYPGTANTISAERVDWMKDPENLALLAHYIGHQPTLKDATEWLPVITLPPHETAQALKNVFSPSSLKLVADMTGRPPTMTEMAFFAQVLAEEPAKRDATIRQLFSDANRQYLTKALGRPATPADVFRYYKTLLETQAQREKLLGKGAGVRRWLNTLQR